MHRVIPLLLAALVAPAPASAWDHLGWAVAPEDLPLRVTVEADPSVPGIAEELVLADIDSALRRWDGPVCGFSATFAGEVTYDDPTDVPNDELHLTFAPLGPDSPPFVRLGETPDLDPLYTRNDRVTLRAVPGAWVVNTSRPLTSDQAIVEGTCRDQRALSSTVALVVGVASGLAVSRDPEALMSGRFRDCTVKEPAQDDIEGLDALYGPWVEMDCVSEAGGGGDKPEIPGVIPFDVVCEATPDPASTLSNLRWTFGDGGEAEGNPVRHTYTEDDNFPVTVQGIATHPTCGDRLVEIRRENYIRACDVPEPAFRVERERGLRFRLVNASDVRTWGCHDGVQWEVYDEDGALVADPTAWEPVVVLPSEGAYRVVLTVSGLAGSDTVEDVFDTSEGPVRGYRLGNGCASVGLGGLGAGALAGLLLVVARRRRRR